MTSRVLTSFFFDLVEDLVYDPKRPSFDLKLNIKTNTWSKIHDDNL